MKKIVFVIMILEPLLINPSFCQNILFVQNKLEPWFIVSPNDHTCIILESAFEGISTPKELAVSLSQNGQKYQIHYNGNTPEKSDVATLRDVSGQGSTLGVVRGKESCLLAMKMMGN